LQYRIFVTENTTAPAGSPHATLVRYLTYALKSHYVEPSIVRMTLIQKRPHIKNMVIVRSTKLSIVKTSIFA